jgi:hypothetical protein
VDAPALRADVALVLSDQPDAAVVDVMGAAATRERLVVGALERDGANEIQFAQQFPARLGSLARMLDAPLGDEVDGAGPAAARHHGAHEPVDLTVLAGELDTGRRTLGEAVRDEAAQHVLVALPIPSAEDRLVLVVQHAGAPPRVQQ